MVYVQQGPGVIERMVNEGLNYANTERLKELKMAEAERANRQAVAKEQSLEDLAQQYGAIVYNPQAGMTAETMQRTRREDQFARDKYADERSQNALDEQRRAAAEQRAVADEEAVVKKRQLDTMRGMLDRAEYAVSKGVPVEQFMSIYGSAAPSIGMSPEQMAQTYSLYLADPNAIGVERQAILSELTNPSTRQQASMRFAKGGTADKPEWFVQDPNTGGMRSTGIGAPEAASVYAMQNPEVAAELERQKKRGGAIGLEAGKIAAQDLPASNAEQAANKRRIVAFEDESRNLTGYVNADGQHVPGKVDQALDEVGFFSTGMIGQVLSNVWGTDAANLEALLDTIGANAAFDELQKMRDNSPTGGALGQVTERELDLLKNSVETIKQSQSSDQLRNNLENYRKILLKSQTNVRQAYLDEFGPGGRRTPETQNTIQPGAVDEGFRFKGGDPADPANWEQVGG